MAKIIVITSGKGGVGKTTTAINLGAAINYFGKDVSVIDCNLSTPNVGIHLGSPEVPVNLNHFLLNKGLGITKVPKFLKKFSLFIPGIDMMVVAKKV